MAAPRQEVKVYSYDGPDQKNARIPPKLLVAPEVQSRVQFARCKVRDEELEQFMNNCCNRTTQDDRHRAILLQITYAMMHIHTCRQVVGNITTKNIRLSEDGTNVILAHFSCPTTAGRTIQQDITCLSTIFRFVLCNPVFRSIGIVSRSHLLESVEDPQTVCGLINQMSNLSSTQQVLSHPFFWSKRKKLDFLADVWLFAKGGQQLTTVLRNLAGCNDWFQRLLADPTPSGEQDVRALVILAENETYRYVNSSPVSLLRFMRNVREHYWDTSCVNAREIIRDDTELFWDFFHSRFPNLFYETYTVVKQRPSVRNVLQREYFNKIAEYVNLPE